MARCDEGDVVVAGCVTGIVISIAAIALLIGAFLLFGK